VNFIATICQLRAPMAMTRDGRLPFFCLGAVRKPAFLRCWRFRPLQAAGIMQLMDNLFGTSFFLPTGLAIGRQAGGHSAAAAVRLLWQHLFLVPGALPEVYVLILPAMGSWRKSSPTTPASHSGATGRWCTPVLGIGVPVVHVWRTTVSDGHGHRRFPRSSRLRR